MRPPLSFRPFLRAPQVVSFLSMLARWMVVTLPAATLAPAATFIAEGYTMRVWETDDGLPQNSVTSAVQTHDGYLWFGTGGGLARFDGERFQVFDTTNTPQLEDRRIHRVFEDGQRTLWIAQENGAIARYRDGRFEAVSLPFENSHQHERIIGLGSDEQGRVWGMRENGAVDSLEDGRRLPSPISPTPPGYMAWTRASTGRIWLSENGRAFRLQDGQLVELSLPPPERRTDGVLTLAASARGGVWLLGDSRIRRWDHDRWVEDRGDYPWGGGSLSCALELRDGTLAVGTVFAGLYLIFPDNRPPVHFHQGNGLPQNWIRFLYEDREANLWVGTGSAGLTAIHASAFSVLNSPDQWGASSVQAVAPGKDGALWIGTDGAGLYHYSPRGWNHYSYEHGIYNPFVRAVAELPNGEVWAADYWVGPYRLTNGIFVRPPMVAPDSPRTHALLALGSDGLLVGNQEGLLQLKDNTSTWLVRAAEHSAVDVRAIAQDRKGAIWCGFGQGGLARLANGQVSIYRREDGLASDSVNCLLADEDGSLWIGTADNGLSRLRKGRFANLGTAHGLADSSISYLLDDEAGYLWLSTRRGIQRISKDELNRCADGATTTVASQIFNRSDGLPTSEFVGGLQAAGCKTSDGRLWFASSKGLVSVDPTRVRFNPLPPPVVFESLVLDGEPVAADESGPLRLSPNHRRLEFRFSGLSFVDPSRVLFKYRLAGFDHDWIDAGTKRNAFYSRLPAGTYRFHVIACNNDGVWNTEGASIVFTVAPFFWQTWWFVGSAIVLVIAIVATLVRYVTRRRLQRRIEQLQREHAIERERGRIAQDIHDDVGASLTRITMLSQPARNDLAEPAHTASVLAGIYTTARDATRSLDEIVWAIDPKNDTLEGLAGYMGEFAQTFLAAADIRCRLDLPATLPPWPLTAETRHNLFLALKEAVNNVLKHAAATEVRISLRVQPATFTLIVRDNGRGFDVEQRAAPCPDRIAAGNGLDNLRRRLAQIGGRCEIASRIGEGTTVSFIIGFAGTAISAAPTPVPSSPPPRPIFT